MSVLSVTRAFSFEAAHYLSNYDGACSNIHGHSYKLHVTISGKVNTETGMVIDFHELDRIVRNNIILVYDHTLLNNFIVNPTAENIVTGIFYKLTEIFSELGLKVKSVKLWETENSYAECEC